PLVASPTEGGVLAMVAWAGLAGLAVGAFRLDLPRRGLGWVHAATLGGFAIGLFLLAAGAAPALWGGEWSPGHGSDRQDEDVVAEVGSFLQAEADQVGQFRAMWVGEGWSPANPSAAIPPRDWAITGARGRVLNDLFERAEGPAYDELGRVVASIRDGATDSGGRLLGVFNVHFVILDRREEEGREEEEGRTDDAEAWLRQRDLTLVRTEPTYLMLEVEEYLERGALYSELPAFVRALHDNDPALATARPRIDKAVLEQSSPHSYSTPAARGPGVVFLAESAHPDWRASVNGISLSSVDGGWGNAWRVPASLDGRLATHFRRSIADIVWLVVGAFLWIIVGGATFSRSRRTARHRSSLT
ncbi:MAG: hypothetical protein ACRDJI_05320, partial [Actinomycetota bacterium]